MARKPKSKASRKSNNGGGSKRRGKQNKSIGRKAKKVTTPEPLPPPSQPVEPPKPKVWLKGTCTQAITPGPGAYAATKLVGFYDHDPTKKREPAFSFATGGRNVKKPQDLIPGPVYNCDEVTRFGLVSKHGPVINGRMSQMHKGHLTPGPGHYSPEKYDNPRYHNAPEARLLGRLAQDKSSMYTPGPGNYNLPSSIGDFHPTKHSSPSARLMGRSWDKKNKRQNTPGPNQYDYDSNEFLRTNPSACVTGRSGLKTNAKAYGPGPGAYHSDFMHSRESPSFSFGIRHAPCVVVPQEGDDCF